MQPTLEGQVILVTGASGVFGRACAKRLAALKATVILMGRRTQKLETLYDEILEASLPTPWLLPLDFAQPGENAFLDTAEMIETQLGRLDGIIHCAAELGYLLPLSEMDAGRWQRLMDVNLNAPLSLTQAVLPLLKRSGHGRAVFIGDSATGSGKAFWGAYGVAKAGLKAYAGIFQQEMENFGLKSLYFEPNAMRSPIRLSAYPGEDHPSLPSPEVPAQRLIEAYLEGPFQPTQFPV